MRRLFAGLGITVLFLACAPPTRLRFLSPMPLEHRRFLKEKLLPEFEKRNRCVVEMIPYGDASELPRLLARTDSIPDVVEMPSEAAPALVHNAALSSIDSAMAGGEWDAWRRDFFLTDFSRIGSRHYLLPRFLETKILVYSKSRVQEAFEHWNDQREEIEAVLRRVNNHGLPLNYQLEPNPGEWDFYDLFVVGWFWKNHETRGAKRGRIACLTGNSSEAALSLWNYGYRLDADTAALARMQGPSIAQLFQWQALFAQEGVCHPATLQNTASLPLSELFNKSEVFLAEAYPRDLWRIHGNEVLTAFGGTGTAPNPDDLGFSTLPRGTSIWLNDRGLPRKEGRIGAATRIWWLGVPARSSSKALALKLAGHLATAKVQIEECAGFGLVPARKDLLADLSLLNAGPWMQEAFQAAARQLLENRYNTGPWSPEFYSLAKLYAEAFQQLAANRRPHSATDINKTLEQHFGPRARQILGESPSPEVSRNP